MPPMIFNDTNRIEIYLIAIDHVDDSTWKNINNSGVKIDYNSLEIIWISINLDEKSHIDEKISPVVGQDNELPSGFCRSISW